MNKFTWLILCLVGAADSALVVVVDGVPADQLTKRVVQHAVDDVIPIVEAPEQVIDVKFYPVPGYPSSVRIESTVRMGDPWRTCGEVGFRNAQDCHDGVDLPYDAPPSLVASIAACLALCAHQNREGKHDKQAKPWEPSHSGPAPHSEPSWSTKEHGDDVPEAIRKLEANNDDAV